MTKTLLRIDASPRGADSTTRRIADAVIARLAPEQTIARDVSAGLPLLDLDWIGANFTPDEARTADQRAALALSDSLVAELRAADTIVIAVPVWNFGVPAALKAWIDLVARAKVTFRYTENGPEGLLKGKRAVIVVASGGTEVNGPMDFVTPYLTHVMGFLGITDVEIVASDRQMVDPEASAARAEADIAALAA